MSTYVVYIDILFLLNFCLDFTLLAASGRFLRRVTPLWRIALASLCGGIYGVGIVFPSLSLLYLPPAAILISLILLLLAYSYKSALAFLKLTGAFYVIAFAMAGAVMAGATLLNNSVIPGDSFSAMKWITLLTALPVAFIIARRGYTAARRGWRKEDFCLHIEILAGGRSCRLSALIDTGNDLRDPLSGRPVVVVGYHDVLCLFPQRIRDAYARHSGQPDAVLHDVGTALDSDGWTRRLRLIPFASIGKRYGMMLGFRPDSLTLFQEDTRLTSVAMVAIAPQGLSRNKEYQAVVNPEILGAAVKEEASA